MCELLHTQERGLIMKGLNAGASGLRDSNPHPIVESELMPTGQRAANLLEAATFGTSPFFFGAALRQARRLGVHTYPALDPMSRVSYAAPSISVFMCSLF